VLDINPRFGTAGLVLAIPLAAYAVFGEPLLDPATFAPRDEHRAAVAGLLDDLAAWGGALRSAA